MLGAVAIGASVLGTGLSLWGNHVNNKANKSAANKMNRVAKDNLAFSRDAALYNFEAGQDQIDNYQDQGEASLGTIRSRAGASGVAGGSLDLVSKVSEQNLNSDLATMAENNQKAYDLAMKQAELTYQGSTVSGPNQTAYGINQFATLLSGTSSAIGSGYNMGMLSYKSAGNPGKALPHQSHYGW